MNRLDTVFAHMDRWRHLPAYQLERRADIFFSAYLAEVVAEVTGVPVADRMIPELPIKRDLIWPGHPTSKSVKVDYCLLAQERSRAFLVELKTDSGSRREAQDHYLEKAREVGFRAIVGGIRDIVLATSAHQKYAHLLAELEHHGLVRVPADLLSFLYPEPRPGLRARQHDIEVLVGDGEFEVEVIYVQPGAGTGRCIDFDTFAGFVERHDDPVSRRFARSLREWVEPAGTRMPG